METNISSRLPIISPEKTYEIDHFEALKTYYTEIAVKPISLNLAYRRLEHISEKLIKQLTNGRVTDLKLKSKFAERHDRYNDYMID